MPGVGNVAVRHDAEEGWIRLRLTTGEGRPLVAVFNPSDAPRAVALDWAPADTLVDTEAPAFGGDTPVRVERGEGGIVALLAPHAAALFREPT